MHPSVPPPPPPPPGEMRGMGPEPNVPLPVIVMNVINSITHMLLGAIACSAFLFIQPISWVDKRFSQHIYLCVTGYVILMAVAVMSYDPNTSWSRYLKYNQKRTSHMILQIVGSLLAIIGSILQITSIFNNFRTAHGILGLIAMILTMLSLIGGVTNLILSGNNNRVFIKTVHSCVGSLALIAAFLSLCFAFNDIFRVMKGDAAANMSITFTVFAMLGLMLPPVLNIFNRILNK